MLVSRLFSVFPENKSKLLFDGVIRLDDVGFIFDEFFLNRMKGLVLLGSLLLISSVLESGEF